MEAYQVWSPIAWAYPRPMQGPLWVTLTKTCKARSSRQPPFSSALGYPLLAHQEPCCQPPRSSQLTCPAGYQNHFCMPGAIYTRAHSILGPGSRLGLDSC